jgi:hypothetical protein
VLGYFLYGFLKGIPRLGISFLGIKKYQQISKRIKEIPSLGVSFQNNSFIYPPHSSLFNNLLILLINKLELTFLMINSFFFTYHWRDKKQLEKEQTKLPALFYLGLFLQ